MTAKELAAMLNGRQYGSEITKEEAQQAKKDNLVVVYGYSDDNVELDGAIYDEIGAYNGTTIYLDEKGLLPYHDENCDCEFCVYQDRKKQAVKIDCIWDTEGYSWIYKTKIPHETFDIMEDGEKFCRGIVFNLSDLRKEA
jgi:hypothetical protein